MDTGDSFWKLSTIARLCSVGLNLVLMLGLHRLDGIVLTTIYTVPYMVFIIFSRDPSWKHVIKVLAMLQINFTHILITSVSNQAIRPAVGMHGLLFSKKCVCVFVCLYSMYKETLFILLIRHLYDSVANQYTLYTYTHVQYRVLLYC